MEYAVQPMRTFDSLRFVRRENRVGEEIMRVQGRCSELLAFFLSLFFAQFFVHLRSTRAIVSSILRLINPLLVGLTPCRILDETFRRFRRAKWHGKGLILIVQSIFSVGAVRRLGSTSEAHGSWNFQMRRIKMIGAR